MCSVSMVADDWNRTRGPKYWPYIDPFANPPAILPQVTKEEFERLRQELEELREHLKKAKKQDEEDGNPDCEMEEKIAVLRELGRIFGVNLEEVFK